MSFELEYTEGGEGADGGHGMGLIEDSREEEGLDSYKY